MRSMIVIVVVKYINNRSARFSGPPAEAVPEIAKNSCFVNISSISDSKVKWTFRLSISSIQNKS